MNFQDLLKNRPLLIGIIAGGAVILLIAVFMINGLSGGGGSGKDGSVPQQPIKEDINLLTTDNLGKALEIQALLAKEGIRVDRGTNGTKSTLVLTKKVRQSNGKPPTFADRDNALIAIVKSGYMDQNVGLEIFDKGDFTSTKEDKRIRLARAINGELARLIRKIEPIESASVFVSIPEQTMFTADKKPITATVQIVLASGDRLPEIKVRAIQNLLLGSVTGLTLDHISITDTNGNVYNSVIGAEDDILAKMQENDGYMTQKVQSQLNKLVGKGNYVVTVSTQLRETPLEKTSITYDPNQKTSVSEQSFTEGLGDKTSDTSGSVNAVSTYLPNGLPSAGNSSAQNRNYNRTAKETQYGVSKTQVNEYLKPGTVEEISIAVTIDHNSVPTNMSLEELKDLIASAASPKATADNVTIALADNLDPFLASEKPAALPKPDPSGNPWWLFGAIMVAGVTGLFYVFQKKLKADTVRQAQELEAMRERNYEQERQLQDVNTKTAELIERQTQLAQSMLEQKSQPVHTQTAQNSQYYENPAIPELMETISGLSQDLDVIDEDEFANEVQSWIERS